MSTLLKWFIVVGICAAIVFAVVRGYEWWRDGVRAEGVTSGQQEVQGKWDADVRIRDEQKLKDIAAARTEEREKAAKAAEGERNARDKAEREAVASRAAADRSSTAVGGMRGTIASLDRAARDLGIPDAASCATEFAKQRDAAVRAREVLGSCVSEYRELGKAADDAWDAVTLRLDTALGYINAVAPAPAK